MRLFTTSLAKKVLLSSAALFAVVTIFVIRPQAAAALSGSQFDAGHIIDDSVFYNSAPMGASEIQNFLNAKVPSCDTDGSEIYSGSQTRAQYGTSRGYPPPYICLKSYSQSIPGASPDAYCSGTVTSGTKTAARIIYEVSKACGINPQVMIVLLQKEQALVTDEWPFPNQYRSATGYGCPDTAPCDSEYYGFFNQVYQAAKAYKRYRANPANYNYRAGRNNTILWHPNSSCGSSSVYIQNSATAGLYIYTPYRPNSAALNNLYGTGNSCSSYGNRNFWRYFNDWFGSTEGTPFFRVGETAPVYVLGSNNNYYHIPSFEILEAYGYPEHIDRIVSVDDSYVSGRTNSGNLPRIARFEDDAVYLMDRGKRRHFPSQELLEDTYGFTLGSEATLPSNLAYFFPEYASMKPVMIEDGGPAIFSVESGEKRHITEPAALETGPPYSSLGQVIVSKNFMDSLPSGQPVFANNRLFRITDGGNANRFWTGSTLQKVSSRALVGLGLNPDFQVVTANLSGMSTSTSTVDLLAKDSVDQPYLLDGGKKLLLDSGDVTDMGLSGASFVAAPDPLLDRVPSEPFTNLFTINHGRGIYTLEDGELKHFLSWKAINQVGFSSDDLRNLGSNATALFDDNGKAILETGMLIRIDNGAAVYLINSTSTKLYVPSRDVVEEMGLSLSNVINVPAAAVADYSTASASLGQVVKRPGGAVWLLYGGKYRRHIPDSLLASGNYNINSATLPELPDDFVKRLKSQPDMTRVIQASDNSKLYLIENGQKRRATDWSQLTSRGFTTSDVRIVSPYYIGSLPSGSNL